MTHASPAPKKFHAALHRGACLGPSCNTPREPCGKIRAATAAPKWHKRLAQSSRLPDAAKKEPPLPAARSDNREASNRVDRSHSVSRSWTISVVSEKA